MRQRIVLPTLILYLGMLNGCGAARPSKFYQLTVPSEKASAADPVPYPVTVVLGPITTSHLYRDDHIVYTSSGEAMGTYEYRRWAEPPTEMINDVLLRDLQRSGRYEHVYSLAAMFTGIMCSADGYTTSGRLTETGCRPAWRLNSNCVTARQEALSGTTRTPTTNR